MKYSFIIPVYNRPDEVSELLCSIASQTIRDFEVIVVEDGSTIPCKDIAASYEGILDLKYFDIPNGGPGPARNFAASKASGDYLLILDSDCILPPGYLSAVDDELGRCPADAFGGPDRAHESFSDIQKAINYSMTSFFTTGGIRGGKMKMEKFHPRSFNMGVSRELYKKLGGFSGMRYGEDIDFSIRIFESGASCRLFPEAWVWHKRRSSFGQFFRQVRHSGVARINLQKRHPGTLKAVHLLPALFTVSCITVVIPLLYSLAVFTDSSIRNASIRIGALSVAAAFIQLTGYGTGFIEAFVLRSLLKKPEYD